MIMNKINLEDNVVEVMGVAYDIKGVRATY